MMLGAPAPLFPVLLRSPSADRGLSRPERAKALGLLARRALALSAARSGLALPPLEKDARGAPRPFDGWHWSLSHKPLLCAGVVGRGRMGIDIEEIRPRRPSLLDYAVSGAEWRLLGERDWPAFFTAWTAKEAVLKAVGVGLAGLSRVRVLEAPAAHELILGFEGRAWLVEHFRIDDHVAALVKSEGQPVFWEVADA